MTKTTIEITASFTGTIPTGSFENSKPFFSVKETIEHTGSMPVSDEQISKRQDELLKICYEKFKQQADICLTDRIAKEYEEIRFYTAPFGKVPSVTSIIDTGKDFGMPKDELEQFGSRGTIFHKQCEIYLTTGKWVEPKNIPAIYPEWLTMKCGNLKLTLDGYNFVDFYKEYPFKVIELEKEVLNEQHKYGGRVDIVCLIESKNKGKWKDVKFDVPTILDIKTSSSLDKTRGLLQQTAYAHCLPEVQQIGLIPINTTTQQGYSKPVMEENVDRFWPMFLDCRAKFKKRFGI